jgi:hypothetical protein
MATKTIAQLKTGRDFVDVLDSALNLTDGGTVAGATSIDNAASLVLGSETKTEAADAASITIPITIIDNDGDEAMTLANGTAVGQMKMFLSSTNNTVTLTPATLAGASTTIAFTDIGSSVLLCWAADGWFVVSRGGGGNAAANAVLTLPVLA